MRNRREEALKSFVKEEPEFISIVLTSLLVTFAILMMSWAIHLALSRPVVYKSHSTQKVVRVCDPTGCVNHPTVLPDSYNLIWTQ